MIFNNFFLKKEFKKLINPFFLNFCPNCNCEILHQGESNACATTYKDMFYCHYFWHTFNYKDEITYSFTREIKSVDNYVYSFSIKFHCDNKVKKISHYMSLYQERNDIEMNIHHIDLNIEKAKELFTISNDKLLQTIENIFILK